MDSKIHLSSRLGTALFALAIAAGLLTMALARGAESVSADDNRKADITFTKWVTDTDWPAFPWDMKGVVGGESGPGVFTGEVLTRVDDGTTTTIHALYHVSSNKPHSFTADLLVKQSDATGAAVISGVVTDGWLKGSQVSGEFATLATCDRPTPGNIFGSVCFKGALHIDRH